MIKDFMNHLPASTPRQLWAPAAFLYGVGLGGFVDGIVLHQILQWHHMVSHVEGLEVDTMHGLQANTFVDGLFHATMWVVVVAASALTLRAWKRGGGPPSWMSAIGLLLVGWAAFNLVEGTLNHHVLGIHHVRDDLGGPVAWDIAFLGLSGAIAVVGWALHRGGRSRSDSDRSPRSPPGSADLSTS